MAREDVNIKVSANVAEAIQMWKAMEAGPDGMAKALSAMGDKGAKAAKSAGDEVLAMATKFGTAAVSLGTVVATLKDIEQHAQAAADRVFNALGSFGELQQVSATPQEFAANVSRARGMVRKGIVGPDQEGLAADIVFAMKSAGYTEEEKDLIEMLGERKFVKPEGLLGIAEGAQKYRNVFGSADAGSLRDVINKIIQEAGTAQASVSETMKAILEVAPSATQLGMSDEETGAGFLAVERMSPNSDLAATKYRSLLDQLNKKKLWRGDLFSSVSDIKRRVDAGGSAFKILEEGRAVQAYENLINSRGFVEQQQQLIGAAPQRDLLESQSSLLESDPILRAGKRLSESQGELADTDVQTYSEKELLFDAYWNEINKQRLNKYGGFFGGVARFFDFTTGRGLVDLFNMESEELGSLPRGVMDSLPENLQRDIRDYNSRNGSMIPRLKSQKDYLTAPNPITIQIKAPDGLDIPHEPAASELGDAPAGASN